jgi:hypothetical protein
MVDPSVLAPFVIRKFVQAKPVFIRSTDIRVKEIVKNVFFIVNLLFVNYFKDELFKDQRPIIKDQLSKFIIIGFC